MTNAVLIINPMDFMRVEFKSKNVSALTLLVVAANS